MQDSEVAALPRCRLAYRNREESMGAVRVRRALAAAWLAATLTGCVSWKVREVTPERLLAEEEGLRAVRVTRSDGSLVELWTPQIENDRLIGNPTERAIARVSVPLRDVQYVAIRRTSFGKTALMVLGVGAGIAVYGLLMSLNEGY